MADQVVTRRSFMAGSVCACCVAVSPVRSAGATSVASAVGLGADGIPTLLELGTESMQRIGQTVWVENIAPGVWLHTTTATLTAGYVFPANGLILVGPSGSLLIDTGYTPEQARLLVHWSKTNLPRPITQALATHFHSDRTGGIDALKKLRIRTLAYPLTCKLASEHRLRVPEPIQEFRAERYRLRDDCELFFPAPDTRKTTSLHGSRINGFCSAGVYSSPPRATISATWPMPSLPTGPIACGACSSATPSR